jgi:hypothetical protein
MRTKLSVASAKIAGILLGVIVGAARALEGCHDGVEVVVIGSTNQV